MRVYFSIFAMNRNEDTSIIFKDSSFSKVYTPVIFWYGRIFGLNSFVKVSNKWNIFCYYIAIVNRFVNLCFLFLSFTKLIIFIINFPDKIGLNQNTGLLAQFFGTIGLAVFSRILMWYATPNFLKLVKLNNKLNPYEFDKSDFGAAIKFSILLTCIFFLMYWLTVPRSCYKRSASFLLHLIHYKCFVLSLR